MSDNVRKKTLRSLWNRIKPTDGPGHTDDPIADIKTHRWIAKWNKRFAAVVFAVGIIYGTSVDSLELVAILIGISAFMFAIAQSLEIEALEWYIEEVDWKVHENKMELVENDD